MRMPLCLSLCLHSRCDRTRIQTPPPPLPLSIASVWPHSRRWRRRRRRRRRTPRLLLPIAFRERRRRQRQLRAARSRSPLSHAQPDSCSTSTSTARHTGVPARPPESQLLAVGPPVAPGRCHTGATAMTTATVMRRADVDCHRPRPRRRENAMKITMSIERPPKSSRRERPLRQLPAPSCRLLLQRARTRTRVRSQ